jgi:hypothetical protein
MGWEHVTASDVFAFAMIAVIGASFGVILVLFLSMKRHAGRRDDQVDELLQEVHLKERELAHPSPKAEPIAQPWEKQADWWKDEKPD